MRWAYSPYAVFLFASAGACLMLAALAWRRRATAPCVWTLAAIVSLGALYACAYGLELLMADLPAKLFWAKAQYVVLVSLAPLCLVFVLQYAGMEGVLTRRNVMILAALPALTLALVWTNDAHRLIWRREWLAPLGDSTTLALEHGVAFWLFAAWSYALLLISLGMLVTLVINGKVPYRRQSALLLLSFLLPLLSDMVYLLSGYSPVPHLNLTVCIVPFSILLLCLGMFRFRLFDLSPLAPSKLLELMPDGVLLVDARGRISDANPALAQAIGRPGEMLIGERAETVLAPWPALAAAAQSSVGLEFEVFLAQGAARREMAVSVSPVRGYGQLLILRDVTELKRLQMKLMQTQKMETIGLLAGGVAHDFNNLLTAITGYAGLALQDLPPDAPTRQDLESILRCTERAARLTHQLLAFARRRDTVMQWVDLNQLVRGMDRILSSLLGEDIALVTDLAPDLGLVRIDRGQIEQALVNLVINGRDAMPEGGRVLVRTANSEDGAWVQLMVSDNGLGMDETVKQHIFDPLFAQEPGAGAGLGLATVNDIVHQHQGQIDVQSSPGEGTTITIRLPRVEGQLPEEPEQEES